VGRGLHHGRVVHLPAALPRQQRDRRDLQDLQRARHSGQTGLGRGIPAVAGHELQVPPVLAHAARLPGAQRQRRRHLPHGGPPLLGPRQETHGRPGHQVSLKLAHKCDQMFFVSIFTTKTHCQR